MKILVTGGTGTVGSDLVRQLTAKNLSPRVLVRSEEKKNSLPAGTEGVVGDLGDAVSLERAMAGVDRLFLLTPLSQTEAEEGATAVAAARKAGVKRIVYMSVHNVERCPEAPHFASKIGIQKAIEDSGIEHAFVMPNNFFQNDVWFLQPMKEWGVYPQPIGDKGLSRVDTRDISDASVSLLLADRLSERRVPLVGPEAVTGDSTAAAWSKAFGTEVRYGGDDLETWIVQARKSLPEWLAEDFKIMYAFFQREGLAATAEELALCTRVLGRPPRRLADYAAEMAKGS